MDDTRTLRRKVDAVIANITIYQRDMDRYIKRLKEDYNIDESDIQSLIEDLENQIESLNKKQEKLLSRANKLLKDIEND